MGSLRGQSRPGLRVSAFLSVLILSSLPGEGTLGPETQASGTAAALWPVAGVAEGHLAVGGHRDAGLALPTLLINSHNHSQVRHEHAPDSPH